MEGSSRLAQGILRSTLIGEYLLLAIATHASVCAVVWSFAAFLEPKAMVLVFAYAWTVLRGAEPKTGSPKAISVSLGLAGFVFAMCFQNFATILPRVGLLVAVGPSACLLMLVTVLVADILEWCRKERSI